MTDDTTSREQAECQECGAMVIAGAFHDFIECVKHRWELAGYEPGCLAGHVLKSDMRAVVHALTARDAEVAALKESLAREAAMVETELHASGELVDEVAALRATMAELWTYTKALEAAYSVWHGSRPSMAPWPDVATDLGDRIRALLAETEDVSK